MAETGPPRFAARQSTCQVETGHELAPKFDEHGLLPCIVTDVRDGAVLMFAYMNAEALALTIETGEAHFYSRSRAGLWKKGETSGRTQRVADLLIDCDQDVVWLKVEVAEDGASCHLGYRSCFFRSVPVGTGVAPAELTLRNLEGEPTFDPKSVYGDKAKD